MSETRSSQHSDAVPRLQLTSRTPQPTPRQDAPLLRRRGSDRVALARSQQALWSHAEPSDAGVSNIAMRARLHGSIRADALERSLQALLVRHESLRTAIEVHDGKPLQHVMREAAITLPVRSLEGVAPGHREQALVEALREHALEAFDRETPPLLRAHLYRLAADDHVLLVVADPIVVDERSFRIIAREWGALYRGFVNDSPSALPELSLQFADFAAWQTEPTTEEALEESRTFWLDRMAGLEPLDLPYDRTPSDARARRARQVRFSLPHGRLEALKALAAGEHATVSMALQAAFDTLLMRYSGQTDIAVATAVSGRNRGGLEKLVGSFANMLPMRTDLSGDPSFVELLRRVRRTSLAAYMYQDLPPDLRAGGQPPVHVSFRLRGTARPTLSLGACTACFEPVDLGIARFDLALELFETRNGLDALLNYDIGLFEHATVERMAAHLRNLIDAIVENPQAHLSALALMDADELEQLLVRHNATARAYPIDDTLHRLFADQAERTPQADAIVCGDERIGYAALREQVNRLAHHLRSLGVGPDVPVGVCMPRCPETVVAMLAILEAGGAYLPIDPEYPAERIAFLLEDSAAPLVLASEALLERFAELPTRVLALDSAQWKALAPTLPARRPTPLAGPDHLAYVIYTSGSTGRPKGVAIPHRGACNHVRWIVERIGLTVADRVLQKTSISFDPSVWEFFAPLSIGAPVILAGAGGEKDTGYLVQAIRHHAITVFQTVPSALRVLLQEPSIGACRSLRYVVCGGEALDRELADEFERRLPGVRLGNFYGPTETSVDATSVDVAEVTPGPGPVPIGRPIANARVYVLDAHRRPVPVGVAGELYIGGAGLARGYLNRPELTNERFVDDPFVPGERMYRTGDLVRWRPDGLIGFIGRTDHQVKIRGFRIELEEVEAALRRCSGVEQATVVVAREGAAVARLVGYVVPETIDVEVLRDTVKSQLPDYMVPSAILAIDAMPMLPSGKLDRKALPEPDWSKGRSSQYESPQGPIEQALAGIWSEVLGIPRIGRLGNFFELGGHSLLVVTMVQAALRRNLAIGVRDVFTHPTIATLAASIPVRPHETAPQVVPAIPDIRIPADCTAITPAMLSLVELSQTDIDRIVATVPGGAANVQDIYPLAPLQEGILYHHQLDTDGDTYLIRRVLSFDSRVEADAFLQALQVVIDRHDSLRTAVVWDGLPMPVQVVHRQSPLPVQWLDGAAGANAREALETHSDPTRLRFALTRAPLMRAYAVQEHGSQACHVALVEHHIIADHASADLIVEEIRALIEGRGDTLEEPVPFRSFVARVLETTPGKHESHFRELLGDLAEPTLPFGLGDTRVDQSRIRQSRESLPDALAERIRGAANRRGVSAAVLFHVAWAMVLARCSGQDDVVFGTVLLGRSQSLPGIDRVIGLCMNTLPMRLRLGSASAEAAVADAYRQLGDLIEHEQAPLALVQRCSAVPASTPLFSALLNYRHEQPTSTVLDEERTNYPLCVCVDDVGTGFHITAQCVDSIDARRVAAYLATAIGALADALEREPQAPVRSLALLPAAERQLLLGTWNETATEYPHERTVAQLFEAQAAQHPDALALTYGDESLRYRELDAKANALAVRLRALGVRPGVLVALYVERSPQMVIGVLATLKAGGTYVPLDPAFPAQRLAFMLEDSHASVLLTQTSLAGLLPTDGVQVLDLDRLGHDDLVDAEIVDAGDLPPVAGPDDLAYVLYTSGSTGKPKGVEITHRALTNFLCSMRTQPGCSERDVLLAVTTLSFDIAALELYLPLITGARIDLVSRETATDGQALRERIERVRPTLLQATPATWRMLVDAGWTGDGTLTALIGGEPLPPDLVQPLLERTNALWNLYGPTETTIWSSVKQVKSATGQITVGRPIANTSFYIVDDALQPVPIGVAGELLIGGDGLARGYRGRPELTAEKFIAHPFSDEPGARLYRTGDLACYRSDGEVVHLGRMDHQVKIRGFRIELGEIETALVRCADVAQATVMARPDAAGSATLVAYVVPSAGQSVSAAPLRQALRETLPEYMVPQHFVVLAELPLLPNGKLDRKALPAPEAGLSHAGFVAARSPLEQTLADIWADVLGCARVGIHDNFFDLGGHSLSATQAMARLRSVMGVALPLRTLFEAPTVAELTARAQAALGDAANDRLPPLAAREAPNEAALVEAPLSYSQEALWFLDRLAGPSGAYNIAMSARLAGEIRPELLERALQALVERHDALRTAFDERDGEPLQRVVHDATIDLPLERLEAIVGDDSREQELARRMREQALAAFDLSRAPLMRAILYRVAPDDHALLIVVHHIVSDGWSYALIAQELGTLYRAFERAEEPQLPELPLRFGDFSAWQRACGEESMQRSLAHWRERLAGVEPLELPTDFPRPPQPSGNGDTVEFRIAPERARALRKLAREHNATLYMVLLAVFQTLLMRHSGQTDIAVGTSVASRSHPELEGLVGFFVNALVMRTDLSADPDFPELLARVRERSLDDYAHDLPFDVLVRHLNPERLLDRNPVYQVAFVLQNLPDYDLAIGSAPAWLEPVDNGTAKFDLALEMTESGEEIEAHLTYSTDLFERATAERMAAHLCNLIDAVVANPRTRLSALSMMGPDELDRLLTGFNDTARPYPLHKTLHRLFEEQASRTPDAVAIVSDDARVDYADLQAQANRLARHLRSLGVRPDVLVGVCMPRRPELVVAMLAVLEAGGAYVPIDPEYPSERIAFMLGDCGAAVVLTERSLHERLAAAAPATRVVSLDAPDTQRVLAELSADPLEPLAGPDDLAYVIYTSGSTGRPKGAMVPHRGVCNHVFWLVERLALTSADRILQKTTISFDASVWEFFAPLAIGAPVVLARPGGEKDTEYLAGAIREQGITLLQMVPSALRVLLQEPSITACTSLRYVVSGGEALDWELADEFARRLPRARLGNMYGPSEASDDTTSVDVAEVTPGPGPVPIGRPIANARVYVLDAHRRPVPVGVAGELYIGGAGLARGYLNRPELTNERFVDDPFVPGERMYRTGDLVRWRPDGLIGFIGRTDHQVKIRGFRIELGEIENALKACAGVRNSAVVVHEDRPGNRRLVAYVEGRQPDPARLRAELGERLPDYMVPQHFVVLAELPLLPNGKLDRKALPAPEAGLSHAGFVAARSPLEQTLADIWADVLGCARVGIHDNFFDLGGHSLSATQAMARLRSVMGVALPLRTLFEAPTVAELARHAQGALAKNSPDSVAPLQTRAGSRDRPVAASSAQEALWTIDRMSGPSGLYNIPLAIRLVGELDAQALERALQAFVDRHPALRTRFETIGHELVQVVAARIDVELPVVRIGAGHEAPDAIDATIAAEAARLAEAPFDLAQGPLLRARLLRVSSTDHVFVFVVHHIVADGWSMGILARELPLLYADARGNGQPAPVSHERVDFHDFAAWQRNWLETDSARTSLAWWREHLQGLEPLALPTDLPRPRESAFRGASLEMVLPAAVVADIRTLARSARATPYMVLLAAFETLLMRYSGQHDFAVGTPVAGRGQAELDDVFGMFVNMLVMRADLSGDPDFLTLVDRVRRSALAAYSHQDMPFERIVAEINPPREPNRNPLFQVAFSVDNTPRSAIALPGLEASYLPVGVETAKFDLSLAFVESAGELHGTLEYSSDLFERATVERMARHLRTLVDAIVENPHAKLSALPLMGRDERAELLLRHNDTARPYPHDRTVHALFREQAERRPEACAITFGDRRLDYATLETHANRLAHHLRALGVGPDVPVGVCMPRSPELVVAVLAVLEAGGAYLPIDPDYPVERIAFMFEDSGATIALTGESSRERLSQAQPRHVVSLDSSEWQALAERLPAHRPEELTGPEHLAYVMYTSGSTGKPKGVMVPHRAITRLVCNTDYVRFGPDDCVAHVSNPSFDAATFEIWGALLNGARLAILPTDDLLSASALKRRIAEDGIDTMFVTTSLFNEHAANDPATFSGLRDLLTGGEAASPQAIARVLRHDPPRRLLNAYGPTETTTFATWFEVPREPDADALDQSIPIGHPIANTRCHVLDESMQLVPAGVVGELWIGGPGLALGYLNRPELTAERFVDDPFAPGERLYRTGDRVRRRADGAIVYCGRADEQVKVRGFRIELGEIRSALATLRGVLQQEIVVREDTPGDRRLTAYLVWEPGVTPMDSDAIRTALAPLLPSFMMPAAFVALDALPITPNGKLDRAALPPPSSVVRRKRSKQRAGDGSEDGPGAGDAGAGEDGETLEAGDEIERALRAIWESVLGRSGISLDDDFFDLGGHSMLAVRLLAEIERRIGTRLRTAALFRAPTIRRFAALLRDESAAHAHGCIVTIQKGDGQRPLFFVSGWGGQLIILNELAKALDPAQTFHVLDTGAFEAGDARLTIEEVAAKMIEDMRRVQAHGPWRLAGYSMGGAIVYEIAQQLRRCGEDVALLALLDCAAPGYPRRRSVPMRVLLHLRKAATMKPAQMLAYVAGRARWMIRNLRKRERSLFEDSGIEETSFTRTMERSARVMLAAWDVYEFGPYPGRVMLVRAEANPEKIGDIDDDPAYGWNAFTEGVDLRSIDCAHNRMLFPPHAASLARILCDATWRGAPEDDALHRQSLREHHREEDDCHDEADREQAHCEA